MQIHDIKRIHPNKKSVSVGRGGKRGKTAGRGTKGQNARAGHKKRPEMRDFIKRLPKLRGRGKSSLKSFEEVSFVVNVGELETAFKAGDEVNPKILLEKKVIVIRNGKTPHVKILGNGDLTKKLNVSGVVVSAGAKAKIEKAGGKIAV